MHWMCSIASRGLPLPVSSHAIANKSGLHKRLASVTQLYAFFYTPNPPLADNTGWTMYSPREEFARMGVGSRTKAWRFSDINKDYSVSIWPIL